MTQELKGKIALVTGGSRGIGRAVALKLGLMGAGVVVNYISSREEAESACEQIKAGGSKAIAIRADVRSIADIEMLFKRSIETFGRLDILVNNAGMLINRRIEEVSEEEYDNLFACNVKSVFFACQQAARHLNPGGRIINISTTVTRMMMPTYGLYAATKGAVDQITRVLSKEMGEKNITVNAVSPGPTDTELFREGKSEEQVAMMAQMSAFGRIGTPEDVAGIVGLLVQEDAGWITGENICVNGGLAA